MLRLVWERWHDDQCRELNVSVSLECRSICNTPSCRDHHIQEFDGWVKSVGVLDESVELRATMGPNEKDVVDIPEPDFWFVWTGIQFRKRHKQRGRGDAGRDRQIAIREIYRFKTFRHRDRRRSR